MGKNKIEAAIPLALLAALAGDQRPATKSQAAQVASYVQVPRDNGGTGGAPLADDLRVSDVVAIQLSQLFGQMDIDVLAGQGSRGKIAKLHVDLSAKRNKRDQHILVARRILADALIAALQAAKLPEALPGLTDVPLTGDDKAAF